MCVLFISLVGNTDTYYVSLTKVVIQIEEIMFQISHTASEADDEVKSIINESIGIVTALILC